MMITKFIIRLDDACEHLKIDNWNRIESLLDDYRVKPLVGVIPECRDQNLLVYPEIDDFWERVDSWRVKGWCIALHGYQHLYCTESGGINPVNARSEFAGLSLGEQSEKIEKAYKIFLDHNLKPRVFFAPSHTFDNNTLLALKNKTPIRIISDTVANDIYKRDEFYFIPQQTGRVRNLPLNLVTCCYHPNEMTELDFRELDNFLKKYSVQFVSINDRLLKNRSFSLYDWVLAKLYFYRKK